jgi:hypothetical protein
MKNVIGRCSLCGGTVVEKSVFTEQKKTVIDIVCQSCGAKKKNPNQIVEMQHEDTRILLTD